MLKKGEQESGIILSPMLMDPQQINVITALEAQKLSNARESLAVKILKVLLNEVYTKIKRYASHQYKSMTYIVPENHLDLPIYDVPLMTFYIAKHLRGQKYKVKSNTKEGILYVSWNRA